MSESRILLRGILKVVGLGLLLIVLLGTAGYLFRALLLQELVRPLLARELSRRFQVEATIDRLQLRGGELRVDGLHIERAGTGRLDAKRLELALDWSILSDRNLPRLLLVAPKITLFAPTTPTKTKQSSWPERPPISIGALEVRDGEFLPAAGGGQPWRFDGRGELGRQWTVALRLQSGDVPEQTLALQANGTWDGAIHGAIEGLQWRGTELLAAPLRLGMDAGGWTDLDGEIRLAALTDDDLRPLLQAFGQSLPATLPWRVEELRLRPVLAGGEWRLEVRAAILRVGAERSRALLREVTLSGQAAAGRPLVFTAQGLLGSAGDPLVVAGQWTSPTLELTRLDWRSQALLAKPLNFTLAGRETAVAGGLHLGQLDDGALRPLLALADLRLPPEPHWSLRDLVLEPAWDGSRLQLAINARSGALRSGEREFRVGRLGLKFSGSPGDWRLSGAGQLGGESLLQGELRLRGKTLGGHAMLKLPNLAGLPQQQPGLGLPPMAGALTLEVKIGGSTTHPRFDLKAAARGLTRAGATGLPALDLQAAARLSPRQQRWQLRGGSLTGTLSGPVSGTLAGRFQGSLGTAGWSAQLTELKFAKPSWSSADGLSAYAGERLALEGTFSAAAGTPARFDLQGELAGGELLYDAYYASLAETSARFDVKGDWSAGNYRLERGRVAIPQLGELTLSGELGPAGARLTATLELPDLARALEQHGRSLLLEPFPRLQGLALAGGLRIAAAGFRSDRGWGLKLDLAPRKVALGWGKKVQVAGLDGDIPLQLGTAAAGGELSGRLSWTSLAAGPLRSGPAGLAIRSRPGELRLPGELHLDLAGGELTMAGLDLALPPRPLEVSTRLTISGVELQALTRELGWPELRGTLGADLGQLRYRSGELSIAGEAGIEVFGGQIRVRGMRIRDLFTRYPVFLADIDFSGLDLHRLTSTLAFGEMNGVIDGHIHQLSLFGTTPTHFEAALHARPKGTRNISVKALNNLSILTQGGLSTVLSRGIYRFIDFYRYRSIGIVCSLENDRFRMRGTARKGSDRYLVSGAFLPPRIDVVTSSPVVSFREMIRRLKRIDRAGSSAPPH
jgi:translocation and assembly module TamB